MQVPGDLKQPQILQKKINLKIPKGNPRGFLEARKKIFTPEFHLHLTSRSCWRKKKVKSIPKVATLHSIRSYPSITRSAPGQASKKLLRELLGDEADYTQKYYNAVQRLLQQA